jgi:hypothetical protein
MTLRKEPTAIQDEAPATEPPAVAAPFPNYHDLKASEIVRRIARLDPDSLEALRRFETATQARKGILAAIEKRLAAG